MPMYLEEHESYISRLWRKRDIGNNRSSHTIQSTTTTPRTDQHNHHSPNTPIRDVCLYALLDQSTTALPLRQRVSTLHRLVLVETLQSITDKHRGDAEEGYSSINDTTNVAVSFYEDQRLDQISLSIMLDYIHISLFITIEEFVESIKEAIATVLRDYCSYHIPTETIHDMIEKVSNQDWNGWLTLSAAASEASMIFDQSKVEIYPADEETSLLTLSPPITTSESGIEAR